MEYGEITQVTDSYSKELKKREQLVNERLRKANKRFKMSHSQEKRLKKIIEICFINKDLNKEWIKVTQLPKLLSNSTTTSQIWTK
jgi:hypothetical protein